MEVVATAVGFAGALRQPGDKFEMPEGSKATWFKETKPAAEPKPGKAKASDKPADEPLT